MKTLLIVDDETKLCQFLSRFFEARGFRTLTAHSGQEALDDPQTVETAFRLGANDYIPKPLSFDQRDWARAFFAADN